MRARFNRLTQVDMRFLILVQEYLLWRARLAQSSARRHGHPLLMPLLAGKAYRSGWGTHWLDVTTSTFSCVCYKRVNITCTRWTEPLSFFRRLSLFLPSIASRTLCTQIFLPAIFASLLFMHFSSIIKCISHFIHASYQ